MTVKPTIRTIIGSLAMLAVLTTSRPFGWSQISTGVGISGTAGANTRSGRHGLDDDVDPMNAKLPESYTRMQNTERQKRLVSDTERLLSLTNQLKASIASSGSETLTPDMLRQMDEIEKLARSVKNKMRN